MKIKMYDFQLYFYQSFVHDLIFFLFTSVRPNDLKENFHSFINYYHIVFTRTLKLVGMPMKDYTFEKYVPKLCQLNSKLNNISRSFLSECGKKFRKERKMSCCMFFSWLKWRYSIRLYSTILTLTSPRIHFSTGSSFLRISGLGGSLRLRSSVKMDSFEFAAKIWKHTLILLLQTYTFIHNRSQVFGLTDDLKDTCHLIIRNVFSFAVCIWKRAIFNKVGSVWFYFLWVKCLIKFLRVK